MSIGSGLDVAVGGASGEMYSWAGDNQFSQARLSDLVAHGTTQSGTYYSFLKMIFRSDSAAIAYRGTVDEDHRSLLEFAFDVPRETSHWVLVYRNHEDDAKVLAYGGAFLADPTTGDLVHLEVHGIDFPKSLYECEISNSFHFERTRVPGGDLLLPVESRLKMVDVSGREFENDTVYLGCHEFLGQSTIEFGPPGDPLPAGRTEVAEPPRAERPSLRSRRGWSSRWRLRRISTWRPPPVATDSPPDWLGIWEIPRPRFWLTKAPP